MTQFLVGLVIGFCTGACVYALWADEDYFQDDN